MAARRRHLSMARDHHKDTLPNKDMDTVHRSLSTMEGTGPLRRSHPTEAAISSHPLNSITVVGRLNLWRTITTMPISRETTELLLPLRSTHSRLVQERLKATTSNTRLAQAGERRY